MRLSSIHYILNANPELNRFWQLATDALTPQDAEALAENLGIEFDTPEHETLERGLQTGSNALKRKR